MGRKIQAFSRQKQERPNTSERSTTSKLQPSNAFVSRKDLQFTRHQKELEQFLNGIKIQTAIITTTHKK